MGDHGYICGESLGFTVEFECLGGVWGNMDIYGWGLLGVNGCVQVLEV